MCGFARFQNSVIKPIDDCHNVDYIDEIRYSKKSNLSFRCLICSDKYGYLFRSNSDHLSSKKHVKNYAKLLEYKHENGKYRLEMFKKFYVESYLSLKDGFFREEWRRALEIYLETGAWMNLYYDIFSITNVIQKKLNNFKFRENFCIA
jgi:hypothetical protein